MKLNLGLVLDTLCRYMLIIDKLFLSCANIYLTDQAFILKVLPLYTDSTRKHEFFNRRYISQSFNSDYNPMTDPA